MGATHEGAEPFYRKVASFMVAVRIYIALKIQQPVCFPGNQELKTIKNLGFIKLMQ
jgi:hypothetical protein